MPAIAWAGRLRARASTSEGGAFNVGVAVEVQFAECGNQADRQVVHAVIAEVFKGFEHRALTRAANAGEDYELSAVGNAARLGHAAYALTRRWWVLGMRRSSRYLATLRRVT